MEKARKSLMKLEYAVYKKATAKTLNDVYDSWSDKKHKAYQYCKELEEKYDGHDFRIIGASGWIFTVGFVGMYEEKEAFFYITPNHDYYIELSELEEE